MKKIFLISSIVTILMSCGSSGNGAIPSTGGAGGSGAVIIRHTSAVNLSIGSGLTGSTFTEGSDKVSVFTAGSGTISFS